MEFVLNNWHLFLALIVILIALVMPTLLRRSKGIDALTPAEAVWVVNRQSGVFVDISDPAHYKAGHIPSAINVPMATFQQTGSLLDKYKERPLVVVCPTGTRSLKASLWLRRSGWKTVHFLAGGLMAWQKQGMPLEK
jgi:rhodanese-related sulfurtransferase